MTYFNLYLSNESRTRRIHISQYLRAIQYSLAVNDIGSGTIRLYPDCPYHMFGRDATVEIYRSDGNFSSYEGEAPWFVSKRRVIKDTSGTKSVEIDVVHANDLLRRRIVAYADGNAKAIANGVPAETALVALMTNNFGSGATAERQISSTSLSIDASSGGGISITKLFARRNVLEVMKEIADVSSVSDSPIFFGISADGDVLNFRVRPNVWAIDRRSTSSSPLVLHESDGSISNYTIEDDYTNEINYVYCGGGGDDSTRIVATASRSETTSSTPFARREAWFDARDSGANSTAITQEATQLLETNRARRIFEGDIISTETIKYQREWMLGSRLTITADGNEFDARIEAVSVAWDDGVETISAHVRSEVLL